MSRWQKCIDLNGDYVESKTYWTTSAQNFNFYALNNFLRRSAHDFSDDTPYDGFSLHHIHGLKRDFLVRYELCSGQSLLRLFHTWLENHPNEAIYAHAWIIGTGTAVSLLAWEASTIWKLTTAGVVTLGVFANVKPEARLNMQFCFLGIYWSWAILSCKETSLSFDEVRYRVLWRALPRDNHQTCLLTISLAYNYYQNRLHHSWF